MAGHLVVNLRSEIRKAVAGALVELAMHIQCVVDQLLAFHLVELPLMLDLPLNRLRRIPVGLVRHCYRHFNHNIRRTGGLLHEALPSRTDGTSLLRQVDYRIAHHVVKQQPQQQYGNDPAQC